MHCLDFSARLSVPNSLLVIGGLIWPWPVPYLGLAAFALYWLDEHPLDG